MERPMKRQPHAQVQQPRQQTSPQIISRSQLLNYLEVSTLIVILFFIFFYNNFNCYLDGLNSQKVLVNRLV